MFNAVETVFLPSLILCSQRLSVIDQPSDSSPPKPLIVQNNSTMESGHGAFLEMYSLKPSVIIQADC